MKNPATRLESSTQSSFGTILRSACFRSSPGSSFGVKTVAVLLVLLAGLVASRAASGTWTNDASSVWSDATNWLNATVANGTDATADFSTIDITASRVVTLDSSRSIGNLLFGDAAGAQGWTIGSLNNVLTLAVSAGSPTVTVTNAAALNVSLAGSSGLTKAGPGILALGGTNTYTGATVINNGSLQITNSPGGVAGTGGLMNGAGGLVAYYSFNKVSGNRVINDGSGGALMDGLLVGNGGVSIGAGLGRFGDNCLNVTQGAVHNNNNGAAIGNGGYMLVNNPVVPFTCTAGNAAANWTWGLWIKTTVQGAAYMYQGSGGWASGNTSFHLTTGASVTGGGTNAVGVRNSQGWQRGTAVINDGNWHHLVMTCSAGTKILYVDGAVDAWQVNQWGGNGVGNQLWIGGTGGVLGDGNVQLVGLIDKVAIYNRALSASEVTSLFNNVVPGLAAPSIPLNSPVSIAAGAKLDVNGDLATVTNLTGNGTVDTTVNGGYLAANYGSDATFSGVISNTTGTLNFYKVGAGKMTIANSVVNNNFVIRQGTVSFSGSGLISSNGPNNNVVVSDGADRAILDIPNGSTVVARNLVLGGIASRGGGAGGAGAVYNRGTFSNFGNTGTGAFAIGNSTGGANPANNGYGYFLNDTPNLTVLGESGVGGLNGGDGVFEMKSGTANFTNWITLGRCDQTVTGSAQRSLMLIRNGTVFGPSRQVNVDGIRFNWSGSVINSISVMDIGPGGKLGSLTAGGVFGANINLNNSNDGNAVATLTVSGGGILEVFNVYSFNTGPMSVINLNNAILNPTGSFAQFLGTGLDFVFVYSGGVTFDTKGFDVGVVPPLSAPVASSIASIPVTGNGSGYIGRPIVQITDGSGAGATAIAEWDQNSGTVTSITITSPGSGYFSPTVTLVGGGYTTAATLGAPVLGTATSGGLIKAGAGTLTLSGGYTYTGETIIQAGGLSVPSGLVTPVTPGNLSLSNNVTLAVDASSGLSLPVNKLIYQSNVTNNFTYGTVSANPANPAINASGSISAPGANIVINVSAFGLKLGQFTLIKYTGAPLGSIANFSLGTLPPGVVGTLVNNTGNDSIDLNVTSTGQDLAWYSLLPDGVNVSSNWDITLTTNWVSVGTASPAVRYQEYTSAGSTVGDPVRFDDTLYNDFINPQATNINLTTTVRPFQVLVDSTLPYSITGASGNGITGLGTVIKSNTGALFLGTSNSYTGGTFVYGGSLVITNDSALGAANSPLLLGGASLRANGPVTNTRLVTVTANSTVDVFTNTTTRLGGIISGAGGLTKTDAGTLNITGTNAITGNLIVQQGSVTSSASNNLPAIVTVGNTAGLNSVLKVTGGYFAANNNAGQFTSGLLVGSTAGAAGDVTVSSGTLSVNQQFGLGNGVGSYAGFTMSGGSLLSGSYIVVGFNGDSAVYNQTGGTCLVSNNVMTIAAGGVNAVGVANFSGGTYTATNGVTGNNGTRGGIVVGEFGTGSLNVSGTASLLASGQVNVQLGRNAGSVGTVNLNGGTVTTPQVTRGGGPGWLNFNGGALKASAASATFVNGLSAATVFSGGAIIDDGGFAVTIPQALLAPNGFGVSSITLSSGGSGYIDSPIVTILGGAGSNAVATAVVDPVAGTVTSIVVTCPGTGYSSGDVLVAAISGGGGSGASANTPVLAPNVSGGLTKRGTGSLNLTGVNTIGGPLTVNAGTLSLNSASTYAGSASILGNGAALFTTTDSHINGSVTVTNGATFGITQVGTATSTIGNLTLGLTTVSNIADLSLAYANGNTATALLNCGTLTLNGTNNISIAGRFTVGTVALVKYTGAIGGSGIINSNIAAPQGVVAVLSNDVVNSTLYAVISSTGPGLVWTGNNSNPALTNVWDKNFTTNWLIGAVPTTYQETVPPGDAVTFNNIGSGTVIVSNSVRPFAVVISNSAVAYAFGGPGNIAGSAGITKLGSGTVTLNVTNDTYTGDTTVSNGAVVMGSASALSGAANLNVGPAGRLELAGFSEAVNGLFGSGVIDDNSSSSPTLTVGAGGTWSGTITNDPASSSGLFLVKNGSGTLVIAGRNYLNAGGGGQGGAQVNGGTMIITNNGSVIVGNSEFWVAQGATSATNIVDGGTLVVSNNWLVVGRANAAADGTLIVNHGLVQKAGANNIVVGSLGASGTLIVNGGQVLNNGDLWLGENATANAVLHLNGGLIQAAVVRPFGTAPTTSTAYFNGGTLQATADSGNYIQSLALIQSGGLVLDDGGFRLNVGALQEDGSSPGGGLTKLGAGTVYLDAANSYSGLTFVTNGTLAGIGSVSGPILVGPNGTIGAGDAGAVGPFTLANTALTIQGKASLRITKTGAVPTSDQIAGISTINYGGTLVISNATADATPLVVGDTFTLFSAGAFTGNFTGISGSPGLGMAYSFNPASGVLSIVSAPIQPIITGISISGGNLTITGTNGTTSQQFRVLASTNVALSIGSWTPVYTNTFSGSGFSFTIPTGGGPQRFFLIVTP